VKGREYFDFNRIKIEVVVVKLPHETKGYISTKNKEKSQSSWFFEKNVYSLG